MGYSFANGGDTIVVLKENVPEFERLLKGGQDGWSGWQWETNDAGVIHSLWNEDEKWHEEIEQDLERVVHLVEDGSWIAFVGEWTDHWRYHFKDGALHEEQGEVVFHCDHDVIPHG
jgi:hypothetical protein